MINVLEQPSPSPDLDPIDKTFGRYWTRTVGQNKHELFNALKRKANYVNAKLMQRSDYETWLAQVKFSDNAPSCMLDTEAI